MYIGCNPQKKACTFFFVFVALGCIGLWFGLTSNGLGFTFDSQNYWYAAQTFSYNAELCSSTGYYTVWTPLFPILLSVLGIPTTQFIALLLNLGGLYVLSKPFEADLLDRPQAIWIKYLQILHLLVNPLLLLIHFFVWSEAWFIVILSFCCILLQQLAQPSSSQSQRFSFWALVLLSNLLCMQRFAGLFFVGAFVLWLCFWHSWRRGLLFACFAFLSLSSWFVRNALIQEKPDFLDNIFAVSWLYSQSTYADSLLGLFFPVQFLPVFLKIFGLWAMIGALFWVLFRSRELRLQLYSCLILCYLACMFFIRINIAWSSDRYSSPVAFLLILVFWHYYQKLFLLCQFTYQRILLGFLGGVVVAYNLLRLYKNMDLWLQHSVG